MNKLLEKIGLTENESKVYLSLYRNPKKSAADVARILKMDKSSAYKAVDSLLSKGLIKREGWKRGAIYSSASPDILNNLYREKEVELWNQKIFLNDFIDKLKNEKTADRSTYISVDKGIEGLMLRMTESLDCKEKVIREAFNHHPVSQDPIYIKFIEKLAKERVKRGIRIRELQPEIDRKGGIKVFKDIMTDLKKYLKEQRTPPKEFNDRNSYRIWDDTAIFLSYDDSDEFIVLTIKDKYIVSLLKNLYDFMWNHSTPVKPRSQKNS